MVAVTLKVQYSRKGHRFSLIELAVPVLSPRVIRQMAPLINNHLLQPSIN